MIRFGVMNAGGGIYWRSAPDWNAAVAFPGNGFYPNTIISVSCDQAGAANVPGTSDAKQHPLAHRPHRQALERRQCLDRPESPLIVPLPAHRP